MRQLPVLGVPFDTHDDYVLLAKHPFTPTIQGEGTLVGVPSLFVRLFGCNLTCANCDTKYTWHPDHAEGAHPWHVDLVAGTIGAKLTGMKTTHVVFTGGEPMLQADKLVRVIHTLRKELPAVHVTLETNGTLFDPLLASEIDLVSLSPKLGVPQDAATLRAWLTRASAQAKIVVESDDDFDAAVALLYQMGSWGLQRDAGMIQPEWNRYGANIKELAAKAFKAGVRIMPQFHKTMGVL